MYTHDEWGNSVLHIMTGAAGIEMLQKAGIRNMPKEDYDKHMESYRKIKTKEREQSQKFIDELLAMFK